MSDFFYSSNPVNREDVGACFRTIYKTDVPEVNIFHGAWGTLGVSKSHYRGFEPIETDRYLCVVVGGPVLEFRDNYFLSGDDPHGGTKAIFERWRLGKMKWEEDLSGPFAVLVVDKGDKKITCVTDLMLFVPVYQYADDRGVTLGTHTDAVAGLCGQRGNIDEVSTVDFVLHGVVTYPYTIYREVCQCAPASEHVYVSAGGDGRIRAMPPSPYWLPTEDCPYKSVSDAAAELRKGVKGYIEHITNTMTQVAQFISGGEDSRVLSGLLPSQLKRDAFIFLDSMNREGQIAKRVAEAYNANFVCSFRDVDHYLKIMENASFLVGSGNQFIHAHPLGFHTLHKLDDYGAVFGGYLSDSLLKGQFARKLFQAKFMPQVAIDGETRTRTVESAFFSDKVLAILTRRREAHMRYVQELRPNSAQEWFELWPITMRVAAPNLFCNRRLFASYEIFTSKEVVKIAASVPIAWKLNRRLFNSAFRPFLQNTKWHRHSDGRLPYFPWWVNCPIQCAAWSSRRVSSKLKRAKKHQGPWASWTDVMASPEWHAAVACSKGSATVSGEVGSAVRQGAFDGNALTIIQRLNLLQVCSSMSRVCGGSEDGLCDSSRDQLVEDSTCEEACRCETA